MPATNGFQGGVAGAVIAALALVLTQEARPVSAPQTPAADMMKRVTAPSPAVPLSPLNVAFQETSALELEWPARRDSSMLRIYVTNREADPVRIRFQLSVSDSVTGREGALRLSPAVHTVRGLGVQGLPVWVRAAEVGSGVQKGYLTMLAGDSGKARALGMRSMRIAPEEEAPPVMSWLLGAGFTLAAGTVLIGLRGVSAGPSTLPWTRESWASNLTVAGSALVTFSGLAAPTVAFHYMTRAQYASLAVLLTGLTGLAAAAYAFVGAKPRSSLALHLVLIVTLGAAISQLGTLGMLVREAHLAAILPLPVYWGTEIVVALAVFALLAYAYQSCRALADAGPAAHAKAAAPTAAGPPHLL